MLLLYLLHWKVVVGLSIVKQKLVVNLKLFHMKTQSTRFLALFYSQSLLFLYQNDGGNGEVHMWYHFSINFARKTSANVIEFDPKTVFNMQTLHKEKCAFPLFFFCFSPSSTLRVVLFLSIVVIQDAPLHFKYVLLSLYSTWLSISISRISLDRCVNCSVIGFVFGKKQNKKSVIQ